MTTKQDRRGGQANSRLVLTGLVLAARAAAGQTGTGPPGASLAALPVALYTSQANLQERTDSTKSTLATQVLNARLQELLGRQLLSPDLVIAVATSPAARARSGDQPCNVIVACARLVGETLHAPWVVMAKVSKTSNLIWLFTGELIRTSTGEILLDDSTELKGDPEVMVRVGTRIFAERVARTVRRGGVTTNFPRTE